MSTGSIVEAIVLYTFSFSFFIFGSSILCEKYVNWKSKFGQIKNEQLQMQLVNANFEREYLRSICEKHGLKYAIHKYPFDIPSDVPTPVEQFIEENELEQKLTDEELDLMKGFGNGNRNHKE